MKVAICTPVHGDTKPEYTKSLVDLCLLTQKHAPELEIQYFLGGHSLVQWARTEVVQNALKWGADYLLLIDADHAFPPLALLRLLSHGVDFVATNYARRVEPHLPTATGIDDRPLSSIGKTGLEEVRRAGLGLCLIEAKALRRIDAPLFNVVPLPNGEFLGEDNFFCDRAREAGLKIMVDHDLSLMTGHVGTQMLTLRDSIVGMAQAALNAHKTAQQGTKHEDCAVPATGTQ